MGILVVCNPLADGDKYVGEWAEGKKNGLGELLYVNGDKFKGISLYLYTNQFMLELIASSLHELARSLEGR